MLLFIISFSVTAYNLAGMNQIKQMFNTFNKTSVGTNLMLKIDNNISELQRNILIFSLTANTSVITQIKSLHIQLITDINTLVQDYPEKTQFANSLLNQLQNGSSNLAEKIDTLQIQRVIRDELINEKLRNKFTTFETLISELESIVPLKNTEGLQNKIWQAKLKISRAEILTGYYFVNQKFEYKTIITKNIKQTIKELTPTKPLSNDPVINNKIQNIVTLLKQSNKSFAQAAQGERNYLFLVNVVIAGETSELHILANKLKTQFLIEEQKLSILTDKQLTLIQTIVVISASIAALLVIILAFVISRAISFPLQSITDTFDRLVLGELIDEIPGMQRVDEIGRLARAANVFKENNAQTLLLMAQLEIDKTELKVQKQELKLAAITAQEANISKSQFLANMSHEIRTPMNGVIGMINVLLGTTLNDKQLNYANTVKHSAESLLAIINDILDFSKVEAGMLEIENIDFNLTALINEIGHTLSFRAHEKSLSLNLPPDLKAAQWYIGDAGRIRQILNNLLSNAIKFTDRGSVTISFKHEENKKSDYSILYFEVSDPGIERFSQADGSTTREYGGTGLGLTISKQLVELMGGEIGIRSELGKGSTFWFTLALVHLDNKEDNLENTTNSELQAINNQKLPQFKASVLLVEDNFTNQMVAQCMLEEFGIFPDLAVNGKEAIDELEHKNFDLIFMDCQMPVMDGYDTTRYIRNSQSMIYNPTVPIIAMTANTMRGDRERCITAGMSDFIPKPVDKEVLMQVLVTWCPGRIFEK
ncbi:MAG: response regulator [Saccharospirillaceae bacterium]|nr:response regulator [Saccharospirillaceae bacterium]